MITTALACEKQKRSSRLANTVRLAAVDGRPAVAARAGAACFVLRSALRRTSQNQAPRPGPNNVSLADQSKIHSFQGRNSNDPITLKNISPRRSKRSRGPPPGGCLPLRSSRSPLLRGRHPPRGGPSARPSRMPTYSLSPAVIWVAESAPSAAVAAAASGQTQSVKAG